MQEDTQIHERTQTLIKEGTNVIPDIQACLKELQARLDTRYLKEDSGAVFFALLMTSADPATMEIPLPAADVDYSSTTACMQGVGNRADLCHTLEFFIDAMTNMYGKGSTMDFLKKMLIKTVS